ncbi:MAG: orotate phosphoribosyltransferase [Clostridia bacterium]|nr:orotate phosphoribosyltransferase [Clostridia bacterium]MDE6211582.1 orotate phosphoribosyltransferase [Clostridia bacterium]MDE6606006.1 orotate phosphoribosyltransferase [Clostridia bacterium]MDE6869926.1 orotate phosphoribosyltransferase [Clostridia bacterium]MDE7208533.1 orotate phosphoribosyltransferase [Clostridia bacterium]
MTQEQALDCYRKTGAILKGHFKLTSGRHSDTYMQSAKLFIDTKQSEIVCKALAEKLAGEKIDLVVSPAIGGILMGYEVARQLGVPNIFAERENGEMTLRRGFAIEKGTKVVVVEDVVTTGGSVKEVVRLVQSMGAEVVAVASLVDRSNGNVDFGVKYVNLISMEVVSYEPDECPICKEGKIDLIKPGSRVVFK